MVIDAGHGRISQQISEFVEGGDLGGAGAGKLLLDALQLCLGNGAAQRTEDAGSIGGGRCLGIDLKGVKPRDGLDGGEVIADRDAKDLTHIGSRIGAHQQNPLASIG